MARQRIGPASPPATVVPFAAPTAKDAPAPRGPHFTDLGAALADVGAERRWLFAGAVEGAPIVVWAGPEKRDKSWAMIDAAVALATGGKWLGAFACERPGPTVYLDGEYGPHEFVRRLARICRGRGVEPAAVIPRVRHYYSRDLSLTNENEAAVWLWQQLKIVRPVANFIDPWRNPLPGDENSAPDTIAALDICAQFRDRSGGAVFLVHHLNKAGTQSGSRALMTRADLVLEGTDEESPWYASKGRTIRRLDPLTRRFTIVVEHDDDHDDTIARTRVCLRFEGDAVSRAQLSKSALRVQAALRDAGQPVLKSHFRRPPLSMNGPVVDRALYELRDAGLAEQRDGKWALTTSEFFAGLGGGE